MTEFINCARAGCPGRTRVDAKQKRTHCSTACHWIDRKRGNVLEVLERPDIRSRERLERRLEALEAMAQWMDYYHYTFENGAV